MIVPWVKKFLTWKLFSQKKLLVLGPITFIPFWLLALGPIFFVKSKFNMLLPLVLIMLCENMIITQLCRAWISDVVQIVLVSKVILLVLLSNFAQCWVLRESVLFASSVLESATNTWTVETNAIITLSDFSCDKVFKPITCNFWNSNVIYPFSSWDDINHWQFIPNCNESSTKSLWFVKSRAFWHKFS